MALPTSDDTVNVTRFGSTLSTLWGKVKTALSAKVPSGRKVNGKALSADITLNAADVSAIATSARGANNGVASLDANGKVPTGQLPTLQSLTAGTDLKIANDVISINTNGTAVGTYAFAEGISTSAIGDHTHAGGYNTITVNEPFYENSTDISYTSVSNYLTAWSAKAPTMTGPLSAKGSHSIYPGGDAYTADFTSQMGAQTVLGINNTAIGRASFAIGYGNASLTPYSFVAGKGNATTDYGQTVVGTWSDTDNLINAANANTTFVVGVGSGSDDRRNGLIVSRKFVHIPSTYLCVGVTSRGAEEYTEYSNGYINSYSHNGNNLIPKALSINGGLNIDNGDLSVTGIVGAPSASFQTINGSSASFAEINADNISANYINAPIVSAHIINVKDVGYYRNATADVEPQIISGDKNLFFTNLSSNQTATVSFSSFNMSVMYHFVKLCNTGNKTVTITVTGIPTGTTAVNKGTSSVNNNTSANIMFGGSAALTSVSADGYHVDFVRASEKLYFMDRY